MEPLPEDIQASLFTACAEENAKVALFREESCIFTNMSEEFTAIVGSVILSGVQKSHKETLDLIKFLDSKGKLCKKLLMNMKGLTVFIQHSYRDDTSPENLGDELMQVVCNFTDSFGWLGLKDRHVAGCRYCAKFGYHVKNSPRTKVSSSSHHTRALATTLSDHHGLLEEKDGSIYTCDKSSDSWAVMSSSKKSTFLSVTLRGLNHRNLVDDYQGANRAHAAITKPTSPVTVME